jgi:hypothetical protein
LKSRELLARNTLLLESIVKFDFSTYQQLITDDLTGIEPESKGQVVSSKAFHRYYFDDKGHRNDPISVSIIAPCVRFLSNDAAVTSYVRIDQVLVDKKVKTNRMSETRVWQKQNGSWVNCHYHQSIEWKPGGAGTGSLPNHNE